MNRVRSVQDTPGTLRHRIVTVVSTALAADAAAVTIDTLRTERSASLRQLDEHLAQHPDALLSTDPRCPLAHVRLTRALWKAGFAVGVPGCSGCRRSEVELPFTGTAGRICRRCYIAANQKTCARCGRTVRIAARRPDGVICKTCYQHDPAVAQTCGGCGRVKPPSVRREGRQHPVRQLPATPRTGLHQLRHRRPGEPRPGRRVLPPLLPTRPGAPPGVRALRQATPDRPPGDRRHPRHLYQLLRFAAARSVRGLRQRAGRLPARGARVRLPLVPRAEDCMLLLWTATPRRHPQLADRSSLHDLLHPYRRSSRRVPRVRHPPTADRPRRGRRHDVRAVRRAARHIPVHLVCQRRPTESGRPLSRLCAT